VRTFLAIILPPAQPPSAIVIYPALTQLCVNRLPFRLPHRRYSAVYSQAGSIDIDIFLEVFLVWFVNHTQQRWARLPKPDSTAFGREGHAPIHNS
jgi:hypothetical protein